MPGLDDGGYFERTWGLGTLALATVVALALLLGERIEISRLEIAILVSLAGLTAWIRLSGLWGMAGTSSVTEAERTFFYLVALAALVLVVEPASTAALLGGVVAGATALALYGLVLLAVSGESDPYEGTLLADPVGYANAMGALAAIGILLAIGLAGGGTRARARTLGAAAVLVLTIALLFTESRGAWISLLCGLVVVVVLHPQRRRVVPGRRLWAVAVVVGTAVLVVVLAGPFSPALGDRPEYWRAALDDAMDHPLLGSGAGSYDEYWAAHGDPSIAVRDAHSLYMETLAELGVIGLVLVLAVLAIPLVALGGAHASIRVAAAGALVAYIVHAGLDWDWEMPVVTLAGIACAVALLVSARDENAVVLAGKARHAALGAVLVVYVAVALHLA